MNQKFEYIDLLRGLAILLVVIVHSSERIWYSIEYKKEFFDIFFSYIFYAGQYGVLLFFLVSAITLSISMENRNESNFNFYIRRFFRIAPLYYFGIFLYYIFRLAVESHRSGEIVLIPEGYSELKIIQNIFFLHGLSPENYNFVVPGGWSIATEMYFYAIFPFLYFVHKKYKFKIFLLFSLLICLTAFLVQCLDSRAIDFKDNLKAEGIMFDFGYTTLLNNITIFLIGIITVKLINRNFIINFFHYILGFFFLFISLYYLNLFRLEGLGIKFLPFLNLNTGLNGFFYPIFFAMGMCPIIISISKKENFKNKIFKQIIEVGKYSYCIYLLHFIIIDILYSLFKKYFFIYVELRIFKFFILFFFCVVVCFYLSKILSFFIEKPGINLGKKIIKKVNNSLD